MGINIALVGNQNSGKTTLFNQLTGSKQHVGNFPGVTVERKEGEIRSYKNVFVTDLPGIYSLSPYTSEEIVSRDHLINDHPDCIINIVDATNIERNLYLTLQLMDLNIPMVLALNMMDEVAAAGGHIHIEELSHSLGVPVVPIAANSGQGVEALVDIAVEAAKNRLTPLNYDYCTGEVHRALHSIIHIIEDHAKREEIPVRFAAAKLLEGDKPMEDRLKIHPNDREIIDALAKDMENALGTDREAALADSRYEYIANACATSVHRPGDTPEQIRSVKIDKVLTNKHLAMPLFFGIMLFVFWLTFGLVGPVLSGAMEQGIEAIVSG
ncbi:MAG: ferrous iron transporter B, partial [Oscillospiraceae bacterium]